jgi:opacity protein-like surface antigen
MNTINKIALISAASMSIASAASAAVSLPSAPVTPASSGATITFSGLTAVNGTPFAGLYSESGFDVSAPAGGMFVAQLFGNVLPSLYVSSTDPNASNNGFLRIVRSGGGMFSLNSFDLIGNNGLANYIVTGFLGTGSVFSLTGNQGSPFSTITGNASQVDRLEFNLTANGTSLNLDNINLDPNTSAAVPEPATWGMMMLGFGLVGSTMRRRPAHLRLRYS